MQRLGLVKKLDIWIPHELKEIHSTKRISAYYLHLKRNEFDPFFKRIITGDENVLFAITSLENDHGPSVMNATLQTSLAIHQNLLRLGWKVMLHTYYCIRSNL